SASEPPLGIPMVSNSTATPVQQRRIQTPARVDSSGKAIANRLRSDTFAADPPQPSGHTAVFVRTPSTARTTRTRTRDWDPPRSHGDAAPPAGCTDFRPRIEPACADRRLRRPGLPG